MLLGLQLLISSSWIQISTRDTKPLTRRSQAFPRQVELMKDGPGPGALNLAHDYSCLDLGYRDPQVKDPCLLDSS